jgi:hypothetical protein
VWLIRQEDDQVEFEVGRNLQGATGLAGDGDMPVSKQVVMKGVTAFFASMICLRFILFDLLFSSFSSVVLLIHVAQLC